FGDPEGFTPGKCLASSGGRERNCAISDSTDGSERSAKNKELSNREVSFYRGREQGNEQRADTKENAEQIQHGTALVAVKVGDEDVGTSVQSSTAEAEEERGETGGNK